VLAAAEQAGQREKITLSEGTSRRPEMRRGGGTWRRGCGWRGCLEAQADKRFLMKWSVKDLLAVTVMLALVLVARRMVQNIAPSFFFLALYISQMAIASVLAWSAKGGVKAPLVTYALFLWIYGLVFFDFNASSAYAFTMTSVGVFVGCASAIATWILSRVGR
jgi:hypothetical protein